ncbi:MAG: hypothetical protein V7637_5029, partial [Mycobacteriales bacterium]
MIEHQIPFVQQFGEALDEAIAAPATARRRRRAWARRVGVATVAMAVAGGGVAAAAKLSRTPEQLAAGTLTCQLGTNMSVGDWAGAGDPIDVCAAEFRHAGQPVPPLVACAWDRGIVVIGGHAATTDCARNGYRPVPAGYAAAERRTAQLQRDIIALENTADCIPVPEFQRRLADLLDRTGWSQWRPLVRLDWRNGRCGAVSGRFRGHSSIGFSLLPESHEVVVVGEPPLSVRERVDGVGGLSETMPTITNERCWSKPDLRRRIGQT